jgi:hypothetical protein
MTTFHIKSISLYRNQSGTNLIAETLVFCILGSPLIQNDPLLGYRHFIPLYCVGSPNAKQSYNFISILKFPFLYAMG